MASVLDIDRLLAAIPGDNPGGGNLRDDATPTSVYYKLKDLRAAARAAERQLGAPAEADGQAPEDEAEWPKEWLAILELSPPILAERSKDLEVAAWLIEALLRRHGFAGLHDGFRLARGLVEKFWDNLYPLPDEDGVSTRVGPLTGLNGEGMDGTLILPLRKVPITGNADAGVLSMWHHDQASNLFKVDAETRQRRIDAGATTIEKFTGAVSHTPVDFYRELIADLEGCLAEFAGLNAALEAKCGHDAPPSSNIKGELTRVLDTVRSANKDRLAPAEGAGASQGAGAAQPAAEAALAAGGPINSREQAFRLLLAVADYFRRAEPHSFLALTIEETVRRGRLPLSELLSELVPDQAARDGLFMRAGIQPPAGSGR